MFRDAKTVLVLCMHGSWCLESGYLSFVCSFLFLFSVLLKLLCVLILVVNAPQLFVDVIR